MDLGQRLKNLLKEHQLSNEVVEALYVDLMQLFAYASTPAGKKLGVSVMTQAASLAADQAAKGLEPKNKAKPQSL